MVFDVGVHAVFQEVLEDELCLVLFGGLDCDFEEVSLFVSDAEFVERGSVFAILGV